MFSRSISVLVIAAVLACPLWCGSNVCYCCQENQSSAEHSGSGGGCCSSGQPVGHERGESPRLPVRSCQGICGGAVFEKTPELTGVEFITTLPLCSTQSSIDDYFAAHNWQIGAPPLRNHGNQGRAVRTLHMSFLC
jgi:hypothetical protein